MNNHPNDFPSGSPAPRPTILHVLTDAVGRSRIHRCAIEGLTFGQVVADVPPVWRTAAEHDVASHAIWVLPTGWRGAWHRNPARQWLIPLRGRWFVETQDGARVEMGPGEMHLGDDLDSTPDELGRVGHDSGVLGDEPCTVQVIALAGDATRRACDVVEELPTSANYTPDHTM